MGFFTRLPARGLGAGPGKSRNPFQGGMGFFTGETATVWEGKLTSQSLSGWDGVFHPKAKGTRLSLARKIRRNPFQGGMGFFTLDLVIHGDFAEIVAIPFRVGWGFSPFPQRPARPRFCPVAIPFRVGWGFSHGSIACFTLSLLFCRNPFQGGMGFFTFARLGHGSSCSQVAIPFRVGWGFSHFGQASIPSCLSVMVAIPFRVGWGFSPVWDKKLLELKLQPSQSLSGWDGVFHPIKVGARVICPNCVAIPFRVGWGFSLLVQKSNGAKA